MIIPSGTVKLVQLVSLNKSLDSFYVPDSPLSVTNIEEFVSLNKVLTVSMSQIVL